MSFDDKIKELKIKLPEAKAPVGNYVATKISGKILFVSGQISIDEKGEFIRLATSRLDYPELPLVIGEAANLSVTDISSLMEDNQYFLDQVRAFVRVGERRWDLVLDNNLRIMLPQAEFLAAFDRLMLMSESGSLFSNQLSSIDMRLVERPTVRMGAASVDRLTYNSSGDL